jgi:predicted anti-sigma-YlaC factor YlaD
MKCHLVRDLLPLYIEGDCSRKTERLVMAHIIKTCAGLPGNVRHDEGTCQFS